MTFLNNIDIKNIFTIDIETVRMVEHYEDLPEDYKVAWYYKQKQNGIELTDENLASTWEKEASLFAEFSRICAVSVAFLSKDMSKILVKEFYGPDEKQNLTGLSELLDKIEKANPSNRLAGHAAKYFDYPFMCKRFVINGMDIPAILDTAHLKPWETKNICTNQDIWKFGGIGPGTTLQAMCTCLGVGTSKDDLTGGEVGEAYFRNEYKRISDYCNLDVVYTLKAIMKIKKMDTDVPFTVI
jgi:hypothetical protein